MLSSEAPDLVALDLIVSVAELGSLGQAAHRHHMSQPAVSMRMSQLEKRLGLILLRRDPSGTRLTASGEEVVSRCRRVLGEVQAMLASVEALRAEQLSHLRIAASLTVAEHLVPGWLGALRGESPDARLTVEVTNSASVLTRITSGSVDIGFVEGSAHPRVGMEAMALGGDRLVVVVGPHHPWAQRQTPVSGAELAATELVVRETGSGTLEVLETALAPWGGVRSRLEMGSTTAILGAARRGEVPAVLSEIAVAEDLEAGRLLAVETEDIDLARTFQAVWLTGRPLVPLARRLLGIARS